MRNRSEHDAHKQLAERMRDGWKVGKHFAAPVPARKPRRKPGLWAAIVRFFKG